MSFDTKKQMGQTVRKTTPEGRRMFGWCVAFGVLVGVVADVLVLSSFASAARYVPCEPGDPTKIETCQELDVVGFALNSKVEAAFTVGPLVALLGFVVCTVFVLLTAEQRRDH